jgi:hypothetical protein
MERKEKDKNGECEPVLGIKKDGPSQYKDLYWQRTS